MHWPSEQVCPIGQPLLQAPQLLVSELRLMHPLPAHKVSPVLHSGFRTTARVVVTSGMPRFTGTSFFWKQ
jgi:hypothetical protein